MQIKFTTPIVLQRAYLCSPMTLIEAPRSLGTFGLRFVGAP